MKMRVIIVIFAIVVAVAVSLFAIYSLECQRVGLRIVLPKYATFDLKEIKAADKSFLIKAVESSNNQYLLTEKIFKNVLKKSSNIIFVLIGTLIAEVLVLSFLVFRGRKKTKNSET